MQWIRKNKLDALSFILMNTLGFFLVFWGGVQILDLIGVVILLIAYVTMVQRINLDRFHPLFARVIAENTLLIIDRDHLLARIENQERLLYPGSNQDLARVFNSLAMTIMEDARQRFLDGATTVELTPHNSDGVREFSSKFETLYIVNPHMVEVEVVGFVGEILAERYQVLACNPNQVVLEERD